MGKVKPSKVNYAIPGEPLTQQEMEHMIHEAENGKFYTMEQVREMITQWKVKYAG